MKPDALRMLARQLRTDPNAEAIEDAAAAMEACAREREAPAMSAPAPARPLSRPALRWHGGKWRLAPWIIEHMPEHRIYVEPFAGAASVLLRKPRAYSEVYNDLDEEVVGLFRVLRNPADAARLAEVLELTPYARSEFDAAYAPCTCPIETARRLVVRSFQGFGADGHNADVNTGFRSSATRNGTTPAHDWRSYPAELAVLTERLAGVVIENRPALDVMEQHDGPETLHFCDPPYMPETRSDKSRKGGAPYHAYKHEMVPEDHVALLEALSGLKGMVMLSGYRNALYDDFLGSWTRIERRAMADGARERVEALWLNPLAAARQPQPSFL